MRHGRALHALNSTTGARFQLARSLVVTRASVHGDETMPPRCWENVHRKHVVDWCSPLDDRETKCLHVQEPIRGMGAQISITLALRAHHAADTQLPFAKCARIRTGDATHDYSVRLLMLQEARECVGCIDGADTRAENRNVRTKQRSFEFCCYTYNQVNRHVLRVTNKKQVEGEACASPSTWFVGSLSSCRAI